MGVIKYQGPFALAKAADYTTEPTIGGAKYIQCTDANIEMVPRVYRRMGAWIPQAMSIIQNKWDPPTFSANGIEANCNIAGYLFWLALGGDSFASTKHTITPTSDIQILGAWLDRMAALTTGGTPSKVQALLGGKISQIGFEQAENEYAKMSISGIGCDSKASTNLTLTPAIATGVNNEVLGWHHLQASGGGIKIGLAGAAAAADTSVTGFKIGHTRALVPGRPDLGATALPTRIESGTRAVTFEITKEFYGATAEAQIQAFLAQNTFAIEAKYVVGAYILEIKIPNARPVGSPWDSGGASDDLPVLTFPCEAWDDGTVKSITVEATDGTTGVYT